jgi:hypothetical protein
MTRIGRDADDCRVYVALESTSKSSDGASMRTFQKCCHALNVAAMTATTAGAPSAYNAGDCLFRIAKAANAIRLTQEAASHVRL